jgi:hypothetical protein
MAFASHLLGPSAINETLVTIMAGFIANSITLFPNLQRLTCYILLLTSARSRTRAIAISGSASRSGACICDRIRSVWKCHGLAEEHALGNNLARRRTGWQAVPLLYEETQSREILRTLRAAYRSATCPQGHEPGHVVKYVHFQALSLSTCDDERGLINLHYCRQSDHGVGLSMQTGEECMGWGGRAVGMEEIAAATILMIASWHFRYYESLW